MKGSFTGKPDAFCCGLADFAAAGLEISALPAGTGPLPGLPAGAKNCATQEELFSWPGLEFAAISLPPPQSFGAALLALQRGLHVICEPPFCLSTTEFEDLRAAAEKAGKTLFPVQPWERAAPWLALQKALDRGLAGDIDYAAVELRAPGPAPEGGVASPDGWQALSMLLACVRRPPAAVEARDPGGARAAIHAHFSGTDGFVRLAYGAHAPRLKVSVSGNKGRLELDGGLLRLDIGGMPQETVEFSSELLPGARRAEWLAAELADFLLEAGGGKPRGAGLRNARYCVKLLKNAFYSASVRSAAVPL